MCDRLPSGDRDLIHLQTWRWRALRSAIGSVLLVGLVWTSNNYTHMPMKQALDYALSGHPLLHLVLHSKLFFRESSYFPLQQAPLLSYLFKMPEVDTIWLLDGIELISDNEHNKPLENWRMSLAWSARDPESCIDNCVLPWIRYFAVLESLSKACTQSQKVCGEEGSILDLERCYTSVTDTGCGLVRAAHGRFQTSFRMDPKEGHGTISGMCQEYFAACSVAQVSET